MSRVDAKIDQEIARKMRRAGAKLQEIADRFGASKAAASVACKGVTCPIDHSIGPRRASLVAAHEGTRRKFARARPVVPVKALPAIPAWVIDAGLAEDFHDFRKDFGTYHAARECRRLKAEAQRPCL